MGERPYATISVERDGDVARVHLDRPDVRNAFDERMIADLADAFGRIAGDDAVRAVVLGGRGKVFCAGADVEWMRRSADRTEAENVADARAMAAMYRAIDECPAPVIGRIHGAAFGGAIGLVATCDVVVAARGTKMAFSEVRLGIIPAVISNFAVEKIGRSQARRYFTSGEVFTAEAAPPGLVHEVVEADALDAKVAEIVAAVRAGGPHAVREAKRLVAEVGGMERGAAIDRCAEWIARIRVGAEAQDGLRAFLEKREPSWRSGGRGAAQPKRT